MVVIGSRKLALSRGSVVAAWASRPWWPSLAVTAGGELRGQRWTEVTGPRKTGTGKTRVGLKGPKCCIWEPG